MKENRSLTVGEWRRQVPLQGTQPLVGRGWLGAELTCWRGLASAALLPGTSACPKVLTSCAHVHIHMCVCVCVCVCLHTPWGPCDSWDLCLPHSPHLTRACACTCAHACACVCACTCPRLPPFLSPPERRDHFPGFVSAAGVGQGPGSPHRQPAPKFPEGSE